MVFDSRLLSGIGVLSAVIEAGSFARAGAAMGLTQPAVSRAVARLEARVGIRLFHRSVRAITLTDEGRRFYEAVAPHMARIEEAAIEAGGSRSIVRGRLRVTTDGAFGHYVLAPQINRLLDRYPDLTVDISVRDRIGDLAAEGFDVALHFGEPAPSALKARLLLHTEVLSCASPAYLARHGTPQQPQDLATGHHCLLIRDPTTGRPYPWEFHRGGEVVPVAAQGRIMVNDTGALLGACLGGAGIAQLLALYARPILASGQLVQLLPDWSEETFPLYVYHQGAPLISAKVRAFLAFVEELAS